MSSNIESFVAGIDDWVESTPKEIEELQKGIVQGMLRDVAFETPIDTGRARLNWQVGASSIPTEELDVEGPTANAAQVVAREAAEIQSIKPFSISYIANNVPYIGALNDGHSQQAPSGYVDAVFERYRKAVEG